MQEDLKFKVTVGCISTSKSTWLHLTLSQKQNKQNTKENHSRYSIKHESQSPEWLFQIYINLQIEYLHFCDLIFTHSLRTLHSSQRNRSVILEFTRRDSRRQELGIMSLDFVPHFNSIIQKQQLQRRTKHSKWELIRDILYLNNVVYLRVLGWDNSFVHTFLLIHFISFLQFSYVSTVQNAIVIFDHLKF